MFASDVDLVFEKLGQFVQKIKIKKLALVSCAKKTLPCFRVAEILLMCFLASTIHKSCVIVMRK